MADPHSFTSKPTLSGDDEVYGQSSPFGAGSEIRTTWSQVYTNYFLPQINVAFAPLVHTHVAGDITSGTFADARIAETNVTQHQGALTITEAQISDLNKRDPNAYHTDASGEINAMPIKGAPIGNDILLGEDSADGFSKIKIRIADLPAGGGGGTDPDAIHVNVAGEIASITAKANLDGADLIVIEDSADTNNKKRATIDDVLFGANVSTSLELQYSTNVKTAPANGDYFALADPDAVTDSMKNPGIEINDLITWLNGALSYAPLPTVNTQTGTAYTLVLTDASRIVEMNNAAANTVTIPTNAVSAFPVGATIGLTQLGAGATTITASGGVTLNGAAAGSVVISGQYKGASLYKRATDAWVVQGALQ